MRRLSNLLPLALVLLAGCDETDVVALRLSVAEDLSGTVRTSALSRPPEPGPVTHAIEGVEWDSEVEVVAAAGRFSALDGLRIADISIKAGASDDGLSYLRISLPRGENVRWARTFVPLSVDERQRAAVAIDPSGKSKDVGSTIKLEVELPREVVGNGLSGRTRGTRNKTEGEVATLVVPIDIALSAGDPIVWHLTWQR